MALTIASAEVEVGLDGSGLPLKMTDKLATTAAPRMQQAGLGLAGKLFGGFLALKGVQAAGDWLMSAVDSGSDLNETLNKTAAVFGREAPAVQRWADLAAVNVGLSEQAALASASSFGDLFTQLGFTSGAASDMSTATVQAAADLGSFNNLETADVADRISAALRGEYDSLQAVIPNINAARVEAEALAASGKTVAGDLTAQERAQAVLAIIHKDGARAMGDFARTNDDYANSAKVAGAQLADIEAEIGTALLPTATDLMSFVRSHIVPVLQGMAGWLSSNREHLGGWLVGVGAGLASFLVLNAVVPPLVTAWGLYRNGVLVATVAQWAFNAIANANPIGLIITGIGLLVGGLVWLATQTTVFQDAWVAVTGWLGEAFTWLGSVLEPAIAGIASVFSWVYDNVIAPVVTGVMVYIGLWAAVITWLWASVLAPVFAAIGEVFGWLWGSVISPVVGYITAGVRGVGLVFSWLYDNAVKPATDAVRASFDWVRGSVVDPFASFLTTAMSTVGGMFRQVFDGIAGLFKSAALAVLDAVRAPVNGIIGIANGAIDGLNGMRVEIPAWVPIVGGQEWGLSIPRIPMLARGSYNAPEVFIAGEQGPELIELEATRAPATDAPLELVINEKTDPLGIEARVAKALRDQRRRNRKRVA